MRNDLPSMNVGRSTAQASHASNAFIHSYGKRKDVKEWQNSTSQGFGTAIVLSVSTQTIQSIFDQFCDRFPLSWVTDPEYGMVVTREIYELLKKEFKVKEPIIKDDGSIVFFRSVNTCAYIFGKKRELGDILGLLPLFPEKSIV